MSPALSFLRSQNIIVYILSIMQHYDNLPWQALT